jgi:hypothetical protein
MSNGEVMPLADVDGELAELLDQPVPAPAPAPPKGSRDSPALVGPVPGPAASSLALTELEAASPEAVRTLRWALHHGESTRDRIAAAKANLAFNLGVWQTTGAVVDPLGDLVRAVTVVEPGGRG